MPSSVRTDRVLLVGHGHPRYQDALAAWATTLREAGCAVTQTTPRTWYGEEVLEELAEPRDLVVYFGHGRPGVWVGYARLNAATLAGVEPGKPHRLVAGLSCHSLSAPATGRALSTALRETGIASRFLGYEDSVRFVDNEAVLSILLDAYREARERNGDGIRAIVETVGEGTASTENAPALQCAD